MRVAYREAGVIDAKSGIVTMRIAQPYLGFALTYFLMFGIIWGAMALTSGPDRVGVYAAIFFSGISVVAIGLPLIRKVTLSDEGVRSRSPWTGITYIPWRNVETVTFRRWPTASIQIRADNGHTIKIPWYLNGLLQLRVELERGVRRGITDDAFKQYRSYLAAP